MSDAIDSRLALAKGLRELADGSGEGALRSALSRSYYSIFHAARALLGKITHENIVKKIGTIDPELAARVKKLKQVRSQADYDPGFVEREFNGDIEQFRQDVRQLVDEGLAVYNRILREIERKRMG